jgi:hypothetical protein
MQIGQYSVCISSGSSDFDKMSGLFSAGCTVSFSGFGLLKFSISRGLGEICGALREGSTTHPFWVLPQHEKKESSFFMLAPDWISLCSYAIVFVCSASLGGNTVAIN